MKMKYMLFMIVTVLCFTSVANGDSLTTSFQKGFRGARGRPGAPRGGHANNARPSTQNKHENADARRQREQAKAQEKREQTRKK